MKNKFLLLSAIISSPILLCASCTKENEDVFEFNDPKNIKAEEIITNHEQILNYHTLESLLFELENDTISLNCKHDNKFELNENNDDILFYVKNKAYSLRNYLDKTEDFDFDLLLHKFTTENDSNKYTVKRSKTDSLNENIGILFEYSKTYDLRNKTTTEYKNSLFENKFNVGSFGKYSVPDLQYLINQLVSIKDKNFEHQTLNNEIRIEGFLGSEFQQKQLENRLNYELKKYDFGIEKVNFLSLKSENDYIILMLDLLDKDGKSLLNDEQKSHKFLIKGFINRDFYSFNDLKTNEIFRFKENKTLFSEEMNYPRLKFKNNPLGFDDFDDLMHSSKPYFRFNLNSFKMIANELKEDLYIDGINDEFICFIDEFEKTEMLNNSYAIGKFNVKIENKKTKNKTNLNWYSLNFTKHKHIFTKGFYLENKLGKIDEKDNNKYFSYYINNSNFDTNNNLIISKKINADEFLKESFEDIFNFLIYNQKDNLSLWLNNTLENTEIITILQNKKYFEKWLSIIVSQYVLLYYINNSGNEKDLIKKVNITIDPENNYSAELYGLGNLPIEIDFINQEDKSMLTNKKKFIFTGFKGFDKTEFVDKYNEIKNDLENEFYPEKNKTLPYLLKFKKY